MTRRVQRIAAGGASLGRIHSTASSVWRMRRDSSSAPMIQNGARIALDSLCAEFPLPQGEREKSEAIPGEASSFSSAPARPSMAGHSTSQAMTFSHRQSALPHPAAIWLMSCSGSIWMTLIARFSHQWRACCRSAQAKRSRLAFSSAKEKGPGFSCPGPTPRRTVVLSAPADYSLSCRLKRVCSVRS